jgi:predicted nucleic acid-binding protein
VSAVFVDTSALFAVQDADAVEHKRAAHWFRLSFEDETRLITHNYVVVESAALAHRRLGAAAVRSLLQDLLPSISVAFVTPDLHSRGVSAYLVSLARGTSLVDLVSFEYMRDEHLTTAFAFDRDFSGQGFVLVP